MAVVNADLARERRAVTFDVESMTNFLDGDLTTTKRRRHIQNYALKDPLYSEGEDYHFLSRDQQYDRAVKRAVGFWKTVTEQGFLSAEDMNNFMSVAFPSEMNPLGLHIGMFMSTLKTQCSEEQKKRWLPLAIQGKLLGTYAQTELGHGTFLRGLETTATFDPDTDEFVLHSPTRTSTKWWPGALGKTSNCCILMAQLIIHGKSHGMAPFFVQFRSMEDHQPLPGVTVGDIGPKFGYGTIDNGFLRLDKFRIPRENMLMKHVKVLRDGTYVRESRQKRPTHGVMTLTRVEIAYGAGHALGIATTIAIRYSAVRHQSELQPGGAEPQILDYQTQQYKLFPYLAMAYGFRLAARDLGVLYDQAMAKLEEDDDMMMPEVHALSSGLKAFCSRYMNLGIEQCRMSCGGHGYSQASGLPKLYTHLTPASTYEGENTVLLLQTARYLLRCLDLTTSKTRLPDSVAYLGHRSMPHSRLDYTVSLDHLVEAVQHRARGLVQRMAQRVASLRSAGKEQWAARNLSGVEMTRAAEAHSLAFIIRSFSEKAQTTYDPALSAVLTQLCQLLACYWIDESSGDFLEDGFLTSSQVTLIRDKQMSLLADLRHNAVGLVDAFDYPDRALASVLGRYDGNVYDKMYEWALQSPLNKTQVHESYHKYLKPMMSSSKL